MQAAVDDFVARMGLGRGHGGSKDDSATVENDSTLSTSGAGASAAASVLSELGNLVSLSDADTMAMAAHVFGAADNNGVAPVLFVGENILLVPSSVGPSLRNSLAILANVNQAMSDICRFVDAGVMSSSDTRNSDPNCVQTSTRGDATQVNVLWAFTHLAEAIAFQSVLIYQTPQNTQPSIDAINTQLSTSAGSKITDLTQLTALTGEVEEVALGVGKVFDQGDSNSMLLATLQDLEQTALAFTAVAGLPTSITSSITSAYNSITSLSSSVPSASTCKRKPKLSRPRSRAVCRLL